MGLSVFDKARTIGPKCKDPRAQRLMELGGIAAILCLLASVLFLEFWVLMPAMELWGFNTFWLGFIKKNGYSVLFFGQAGNVLLFSYLFSLVQKGLFPVSLRQSQLFNDCVRLLQRNRPPTIKLEVVNRRVSQLVFPYLACYTVIFACLLIYSCGGLTVLLGLEYLQPWTNSRLSSMLKNHGWLTTAATLNLDSIRNFLALLTASFGAIPLTLLASAFSLPRLSSLRLTPSTIEFPAKLGALTNRRRKWVDIASVSLTAQGELIFKFRTGGQASIPTSSLIAEDMSVLLQAIEELCVDCQVDERLTAFAAEEANQSMLIPSSFTHLWNEGLTHQFKATVFTPCEIGALLQNDSIRIVRQLASTPWSATFLARVNGRTLVVLKELLLPHSDTTNEKAHELFLRECEIIQSLEHPGIAKLQDRFSENGRDYLMLDYKPGQDLQQLLGQKIKLDVHVVCEVAMQICDVLTYLHERPVPIVHRDVSPDNIVIDEIGNVRLIDFGAAKHLVQNATGTLIGKQAYIAPEQLRGRVVPQSDLYSLGATMYTLLTGKQPLAIKQCSPKAENAKVSDSLDTLVQELTNFDEQQRPQSATAVRARLIEINSLQPNKIVFLGGRTKFGGVSADNT